MEEHTRNEVVEDLADLGVLLLVIAVALNELILANGEVSKALVVEVDVLFHITLTFITDKLLNFKSIKTLGCNAYSH